MCTLSYSHIKDNLYKIKTKDGKLSTTRINSKDNRALKNQIIEATAFLPANSSFSERIYCITNNINYRLRCDITNEFLNWSPSKQRYCNSKTKGYRARVSNSSNIKEVYIDIKRTFTEKYKNNDFKIYDKQEVIDTITRFKTNIKLWDIRENYDLFCSVLYYTDFLPQEAQWGERFFCLRNNITQRILGRDGGFATYIDSQRGYSVYSSRKEQHNSKLRSIIEEVSKTFDILEPINRLIDQRTVRVRCKTCNTEKTQLFICGNWQDICCNKCTGYGVGRSRVEGEIVDFIRGHGFKVECNVSLFEGSTSEVDIYVPQKNIAIEYNGILWHSYGTTYPNNADRENITKYREQKKNIESAKLNINLITIFETEWLYKREIVKSILLSKLGVSDNRIYGRKCVVRTLTKNEKSLFYNENHIQGNCQSFYDVGLIYEGDIVCAMSFSKRKISKQSDVELVRFCNKLNTTVVGGFSKLFKFSLDVLRCNIISYCDLRYSDGNLYKQNGFILKHVSPPNYFYTRDCVKLESRLKYQKHKLVNTKSFDKNKTETDIMYSEGFRKIYDCGNLTFLYLSHK
jgi:hypothetical protein